MPYLISDISDDTELLPVNATLSNPTAVQPTFLVDRPGPYTAQLIVNDGQVDSAPATTTITAVGPPQVSLEPVDGALNNELQHVAINGQPADYPNTVAVLRRYGNQ